MNVVIVDTECANLTSVRFAVERLGYSVLITDDAEQIRGADRVILPGVGTAVAAMRNLKRKQLVQPLCELTQPVLGICLGMQLLTSHSEEGNVGCLNLIPAKTKRLRDYGLPLPHMGWNTLQPTADNPLVERSDSYCYFVHSFAVAVDEYTIASSEYGERFASMIRHNNYFGAQFHPERSGKTGEALLKRFLELTLC
ncbi:UNVERIFIED_ORG: imidazole glycerol phosphate synthase subunit HisH [Idiomarina abyssalis]|uniref:imidazole glycerol phosphate synthase subunit HisH n=1 Tax=unclassified Idiomarina TaxID=2614829 RepID=UPI000E0E7D12|nr:imidazole glycerol phosphate synthase subunit HisH [Idiomarina sp. 017G]TDO49546.1 imidazole glycerol phosphate synthase subunit HisH [Idiomarina sp. 017G]